MWKNESERRDDPQTPESETQRLARDEYERPLYGSPEPQGASRHHGSPPRQNQGPSYDHAAWSYRSQPQQQRDAGAPARTLDDIRAHELMTRRVGTVHPATSVERAARLMAECDCGALPVVGDNGVLVGMVTDRDIAIRVVARGREVRNAIVADCMTEHVYACYANESIADCMRQMARHQVRRMPIVDERGRLIGILAQSDLARHSVQHPIPEERRALAQVVGEVSQPVHTSRR